jgi:hypothetical protein
MIKYSLFQGLYFEDFQMEKEYEISLETNLKSKFKIFFSHSAVILIIYFLFSLIIQSPNYYVFIFLAWLFILIFLLSRNFKHLTIISIIFSIAKKVYLFESLISLLEKEIIPDEQSIGIYFFGIYFVLLTINQSFFCSNNALYHSIYVLIISFYMTARLITDFWMGILFISIAIIPFLINLFHEEIRKRRDFRNNFFQMNDFRFYKHILDQEFREAAIVLTSQKLKKNGWGVGFRRIFKSQNTCNLNFF